MGTAEKHYWWEWVGIYGVCSKNITAWEGILCHNFLRRRRGWTPCRSVSCTSFHHADLDLVFPLNKPLRDKYSYYRRRREDESIYLVEKKRDCIFAPHQCEKCWFVNLCGSWTDLVSLADSQTLSLLLRAKLNIFWSCNTSMIHGMLVYAKELVSRARETGRSVPLSDIVPWTVGYRLGVEVETQMLYK